MFLAPKNFWGGSPKISARDYKIEHTLEHRAKFRADRPTELGDYAREKKKPQQNLSPLPQAIAYGRTKKPTVPPTSEAQRPNSSHGESDLSEVRQFHARYVDETLSSLKSMAEILHARV